MVIIADSGSTKTSWCILNGNQTSFFDTEGYNPYYMDTHYIQRSMNNSFGTAFNVQNAEEIFFYGAGCSKEKSFVVEKALKGIFPVAKINVESDLIAAAKSVLGDEKGFVAILGTGTNTGIFDGKRIIEQVDSLGFLLGDEGSGAYLGKKLLSLYARKAMPNELMNKFSHAYQIDPRDVVKTFYDSDLQNRYSASFARFLSENTTHDYIKNLVNVSFVDLFENIITLYADFKSFKLNSVGSIGFTFSFLLEEVANKYGMQVGKIIKSPIEGLVDYHRTKTGLSI